MANNFSLRNPAQTGWLGTRTGLCLLLLWLGGCLGAAAQTVCSYTSVQPIPGAANFTGTGYPPYRFYHADGSDSPTFYRGETIFSYAPTTTGNCRTPASAVFITPVMPAGVTALCTPVNGPQYVSATYRAGLYQVLIKTCQAIGPNQFVYSRHQKFSAATPGSYSITFQNGNGTTTNLTIVSRVCVTTDCGTFGGVYEQTGMRNGKVALADTDGNELYFENGTWRIANGGSTAFEVVSADDYPPTTGWQSVGACAGVALTVSEGNCSLPTPPTNLTLTLSNACQFSGDYVQTGVAYNRAVLTGPNGNKIEFEPSIGWIIREFFTAGGAGGGSYRTIYGINSQANEPPASGWRPNDYTANPSAGNYACTSDPILSCTSLSITATPSLTIAPGGSVTLTASGADSYTWSDGTTDNPLILTNITSATVFSVTGVLGTCPIAATTSAEVSVTAPPGPVITVGSLTGTATACAGTVSSTMVFTVSGSNLSTAPGNSLNVIASPGFEFLGLDGYTNQDGIPIPDNGTVPPTLIYVRTTSAAPSGSLSGTITLTSAGATSRTLAVSATVISVSAGIVAAGVPGNQTICPGQSTTLTASGGTTFAWSNGSMQSAITVSPTSTTAYQVTVSTGGCSATTTATVTVNPAVTATITPNPGLTVCANAGGLLTASAGSGLPAGGGGTYRWNTNATTSVITVNTSGPYTVTATSSIGCSSTATVTVTALNSVPLVQPMLSASSPVCEGGSVSITATVTGNEDTYEWYRNGPAGVPVSLGSAQSSSVLTLNGVSSAQAGSYVLVIRESGCGSATSTAFTLTVNPLPVVTIAFPTVASVNPAGPVVTVPVGQGLSYQVFGGGSNARYERRIVLDRPNFFEIRVVTENRDGLFPIDRAGLYSIIVTDNNGCSRTVTGEIRGQ